MPSLLNSNAGPASALTWGGAKARIARAAGGSNDPENLQVAGEMLAETIQFWNARKHWRFLQTIASDITLVVGTAEYDLPTTIKVVYDATLEGVKQPLQQAEGRDVTRASIINQPNGMPALYTVFDTPTTGKIRLEPPPDSATYGPLVVRYLRNIVTASSDSDPLDIPARYEAALLAGARARYLAMKGDESAKISYWNKAAEDGLIWAIVDDNNQPDLDPRFRPSHSMSAGRPLVSVDGVVLREDYW